MREKILLLGSTGSIGRQTLDILKYSSDYELVGISLKSRFQNLEDYLFYFDSLKYVAIEDEKSALEFKAVHPSYTVISGKNCSVELIKSVKGEKTVFNALMGNCGLLPSLEAIKEGCDLLLSNKESLVIGSSLIKKALETSQSHLYPVDSEHVALAKLLKEAKRRGITNDQITKLTVTASGGSLRDMDIDQLDYVQPETVLHHPTWNMGNKITVDCATLVNKGYEVIEASVLFDFPLEKVDAIICRESLVHALLTYEKDGKEETIMEYSPCDMKVAISYALSKGELNMHEISSEDEENIKKLHFGKIDNGFYPLFRQTINAFKTLGNAGMIYYNAIDSLAIQQFLDREIPFVYIREALGFAVENIPSMELTSENLPQIEAEAEKFALQTMIKVSFLYPGGK
ncbi:MAG: hypothetical protein WCR67_05655 [Bacilli bacterium]